MKKLPVDGEDVGLASRQTAGPRHGHQRHHHRVLFLTRLAEYQLPVAAIKMDAAQGGYPYYIRGISLLFDRTG